MNIWQWVEKLQEDLAEAGQAHSAELIDKLTSEICDLEVERAEALLPEAKALAKTLENPWLEVFVRHWEMRNRLGNKGEGETALPEVVSLFEFAHRKETADCPQSVCVTQDLSACYANIDGPGWVRERIEVCDETLARIDPTWACYQCLSNEKAEALLDDGQGEEALAYLEAQAAKLEAAGEEVGPGALEVRQKILLALGRYDETLARIEAHEKAVADEVEWRNVSLPRQILKAQALAGLERDDEAWEALPALNEISPGDQHKWLRAAYPLFVRHPDQNTWRLAGQLQAGLDHYAAHGAHRTVVDMAVASIRLALARGAAWTARRQLELAQKHAALLRKDGGAAAQLADLSDAIDRLPQSALPAPAEELMAWLEAQGENTPRDPEKEVQWLLEALRQRPEDTALREQAVSALKACGAEDAAVELLWAYVKTHAGQEENLAYTLMGTLLDRGDEEGVERLARLYETASPLTTFWCRAQLARRRGDWPAAENFCRALLERSPSSLGAHRLLAHSLMEQRRFAEAADCYRQLAAKMEDDRSVLWDTLTAATAAEDWATVREIAGQLEMTLATAEGPIDEDWGWVIIRYDEDGDARDYWARRTGPVSATILENAADPRPQHVLDRIVFDADPLIAPPEDEEERKRFTPTFRLVHVLQPGGYGRGWLADGADPGEAAFKALRQDLEAKNWQVWVHSSENYTVTDSTTGDTLPGIYFTVAAPEGVAPREIHQTLAAATRPWPHRLCWLRLAEHCDADLTPHQETIERYRL